MYDFYKSFIFLSKNFFFQIKLCIQNKYLYLLNFIFNVVLQQMNILNDCEKK